MLACSVIGQVSTFGDRNRTMAQVSTILCDIICDGMTRQNVGIQFRTAVMVYRCLNSMAKYSSKDFYLLYLVLPLNISLYYLFHSQAYHKRYSLYLL